MADLKGELDAKRKVSVVYVSMYSLSSTHIHYTTLHYTTLNPPYKTLYYTTLHNTTLHYTSQDQLDQLQPEKYFTSIMYIPKKSADLYAKALKAEIKDW
jgi:hypothetical protein